MLSIYPAIFFKEKPKGYSVLFPDLNHLATCGEDEEEAMEMAIDCLAGYLYTSWMDNETVPEPSKLKEIDLEYYLKECEADEKDTYITLVSVNVEEYAKLHFCKSVRKTLTIPEWMDKEARKAKINFSKTLQEALLQKLNL